MNVPNRRERRNIGVFLLFSAMYGVATNICAEGYVQAYLLRLGFDTGGIRNYGIAVQAASIAAYLLFTRLPAQKGMQKINAAAALCMGIFPAVLAVAGKLPSFAVLYIIILCAAALHGFLTAARSVAEYNITPYLFARSLYGSVTGKALMIGGVIPVCISLGAGFLLGRESAGVYTFLFGVCAAAFGISAVFALLYRMGGGEPGEVPPHASLADVVRTASCARYVKLLLPHFLRGVGMAGMYYIIPSALNNISLAKNEEPFLIVIPVAATVAGSFLYMLLDKKMRSGAIAFSSVLACSLLMPLLVLLNQKYVFLSIYFVFFLFNIISQLSIPTGVLRSTPNSWLSLISSMRLLLMSAANSLFIFIFGLCLKFAPPVYVMLLSGTVFALCGCLYKKQFSDRLQ